MSDDEDFMSDAFLTMASNDPTHMVETYSQKRRKLVAQQREQAIIKPIKERVMERVQQGLDTRIDESNKGFKLLAKMGFK